MLIEVGAECDVEVSKFVFRNTSFDFGCRRDGEDWCKTSGIAMSESMFVTHVSFAHSCRFLCAISGVSYYAISAFDSNPRF